jgi:hypothetical protein
MHYKLQYMRKHRPYELNARFSVTVVQLCFQSERIFTSHVKPCLISRVLIIIDMPHLFKWHVYVESCNKNDTQQVLCLCIAGGGVGGDCWAKFWTFTNKQTKGLVKFKYPATWRGIILYRQMIVSKYLITYSNTKWFIRYVFNYQFVTCLGLSTIISETVSRSQLKKWMFVVVIRW